MTPTVHLFARWPEAGRAKTRLIPALGAEGAAALHRRLVERTVATVRDAGLKLVVRSTGGQEEAFRRWLGDGLEVVDQGAGDLGERLARVAPPAILLGADIPGLTAAHLTAAAKALAECDAAIGPATDGGYYLLGFRVPIPAAFEPMAWGTDGVFAETVHRIEDAGASLRVLGALDDCDRPEDLARWPELTA